MLTLPSPPAPAAGRDNILHDIGVGGNDDGDNDDEEEEEDDVVISGTTAAAACTSNNEETSDSDEDNDDIANSYDDSSIDEQKPVAKITTHKPDAKNTHHPRAVKKTVKYTSDDDDADGSNPTYRPPRGDDDSEDYANMSDLDMSDNDYPTKKQSGRKRNTDINAPIVPKKGTVPDEEYQRAVKIRKAYTDSQRYLRAKRNHSTVPDAGVCFTGERDEQLRLMAIVKANRLQKGHTFPNKDILILHIAEEANLRMKYTTTYRSDAFNCIVFGDRFFVGASFTPSIGWIVKIAAVREGDEGLNVKMEEQLRRMNIVVQGRRAYQREKLGTKSTKTRAPRTPIHMDWIADIIKPFLSDNPASSYEDLRTMLALYVNEPFLTDSLLQDAKELALDELFGSPNENVKYASGVVSELVAMGHHAELQFGSRKDVTTRIGKVILAEEALRRKEANEVQIEGRDRKAFVDAWMEKHAQDLEESLGLEDGPTHRFLLGICFATSTSTTIVPNLQKTVQADAAHMSIGKYTLFSAYGTTANGNMSPIAFAILFGNEDMTNWKIFWKFVLKVQVCCYIFIMRVFIDTNSICCYVVMLLCCHFS
jgi:hypothetical protein